MYPSISLKSLAFSLTPRFASVVEIQPRLSSKVKVFEGELSESSKRRHGFTACYHKEKAMRNMYRVVTTYQNSRSLPPNNPNLDTRLGLLLFARKAAKHGASALVPVALCPSGAVSGRAFWLYGRVWGNGKQLSRYPMPLSRYPIGPTRYPIEKCGQAVQKKLSTDIPQNCLYYPVLIYRTVSCISRREYASRTI